PAGGPAGAHLPDHPDEGRRHQDRGDGRRQQHDGSVRPAQRRRQQDPAQRLLQVRRTADQEVGALRRRQATPGPVGIVSARLDRYARTGRMRAGYLANGLAAVALLLSACAEPPVRPIAEAARRSVTSISADVSGIKHSDTSKLGARGSAEGAQLGAQQGASLLPGAGGVLGLAVMGVGAIVGGVKGANEAQREDVVDQTRVFLRTAVEDTDFTELLRSRLAASKAAGDVEIINVTSQAVPLSSVANSAAVPGHFLAIEYRLGIEREDLVNPKIGVLVLARARVRDPGAGQQVHEATWA